MPFYALMRCFPPTRRAAERLGLVSIKAMVTALVKAVKDPPASGVRIVEVPEIKAALRHH